MTTIIMTEKETEKVIRVYADGVFDAFHIGHANMFKQCRETFPGQKIWLIAGVCDQEGVEEFKGNSYSIQARPSAPRKRGLQCVSSASGWTRCCRMPHG